MAKWGFCYVIFWGVEGEFEWMIVIKSSYFGWGIIYVGGQPLPDVLVITAQAVIHGV